MLRVTLQSLLHSLSLSPLDRDFFPPIFRGAQVVSVRRTISRKPRLIALLPGAKYSVRILASLPSSRFKCIVKVGPRLNNGKRASGYREERVDETRALFCMNFYEISRYKTRDSPIGTRVHRVPVTGHKFQLGGPCPWSR